MGAKLFRYRTQFFFCKSDYISMHFVFHLIAFNNNLFLHISTLFFFYFSHICCCCFCSVSEICIYVINSLGYSFYDWIECIQYTTVVVFLHSLPFPSQIDNLIVSFDSGKHELGLAGNNYLDMKYCVNLPFTYGKR